MLCLKIVPLYKVKGEGTKCRNYRAISLLSLVGKIYVGSYSLIDDEQGGFRAGRGYVDQISTLKQIDEKAQEKKT